MEKRIKYSQFQQVKYAAKMIDPLHRKMISLKKKIEGLVAEYKGYQTQIDALEAGIVSTLGFHVSDLVQKVIEPTGNTDKNGNPVKVTKYVETDMVHYDEQSREYVVTVPGDEPVAEIPVEEKPESDVPAEEEENEEIPSNDTMFND